jgi:hypothetical protein
MTEPTDAQVETARLADRIAAADDVLLYDERGADTPLRPEEIDAIVAALAAAQAAGAEPTIGAYPKEDAVHQAVRQGFAAGVEAVCEIADRVAKMNWPPRQYGPEAAAEKVAAMGRTLRPPTAPEPTVEQIARLLLGRRIDTWGECLEAANAIRALRPPAAPSDVPSRESK